jgi:hypothetical protein
MAELTHTTTLVTTSCWCGIPLAIPRALYNEMHDSGKHAFCPLGHQFVFGDTWKDKAEREKNDRLIEMRRHSATRDLLAAEERSHTATKGHLARQRKRAQAGVCPCCNRTFQQLARHMANKHPDFRPENGTA